VSNVFKHIVLGLFALGVLIFLAKGLPYVLGDQYAEVLPGANLPPGQVDYSRFEILDDKRENPHLTEADLVRQLGEAIGVYQVRTLSERRLWLLSKGSGLVASALEAKKWLEDKPCHINRMREHSSPHSIDLDVKCSTGFFPVRIQEGTYYRPGSSQLRVFFYGDSLTLRQMHVLESLDFPYTLIIDPFKAPRQTFHDLNKLRNAKIMIRLPLEPDNYPYVNPGRHTLLISMSKEAISDVINQAFRQLPQAIGVASSHGSRALNNRAFTHLFLSELESRRAIFLNLLLQENVVAQLCRGRRIHCIEESINLRVRETKEHYIYTKLHRCSRLGEELIALPLSLTSLKAVENLKERARLLGIEIVELNR
jgi:polysaccharide deacetylase 2 family uncharacterized protein YibQ